MEATTTIPASKMDPLPAVKEAVDFTGAQSLATEPTTLSVKWTPGVSSVRDEYGKTVMHTSAYFRCIWSVDHSASLFAGERISLPWSRNIYDRKNKRVVAKLKWQGPDIILTGVGANAHVLRVHREGVHVEVVNKLTDEVLAVGEQDCKEDARRLIGRVGFRVTIAPNVDKVLMVAVVFRALLTLRYTDVVLHPQRALHK